ncbi:hypothetical protein GCM10023335_15100 [Streptomyces siamensis]|uniref:Uncharacterized protein n=1 Tax=Streptomyces siamensis TaxID=1274986 RepID=A0ABP9IKN2_9ACTN
MRHGASLIVRATQWGVCRPTAPDGRRRRPGRHPDSALPAPGAPPAHPRIGLNGLVLKSRTG